MSGPPAIEKARQHRSRLFQASVGQLSGTSFDVFRPNKGPPVWMKSRIAFRGAPFRWRAFQEVQVLPNIIRGQAGERLAPSKDRPEQKAFCLFAIGDLRVSGGFHADPGFDRLFVISQLAFILFRGGPVDAVSAAEGCCSTMTAIDIWDAPSLGAVPGCRAISVRGVRA